MSVAFSRRSNFGDGFHQLRALSEAEPGRSILILFLLRVTIEGKPFAADLQVSHVLLLGHFGSRTGTIFIVRFL